MKAKHSFIVLLLTVFTAQTAMAQIEGYWKGEMNLGVQKLETAFDIKGSCALGCPEAPLVRKRDCILRVDAAEHGSVRGAGSHVPLRNRYTPLG